MKQVSILATFIIVSSSLFSVACITPLEQPNNEKIASTTTGQSDQSITNEN